MLLLKIYIFDKNLRQLKTLYRINSGQYTSDTNYESMRYKFYRSHRRNRNFFFFIFMNNFSLKTHIIAKINRVNDRRSPPPRKFSIIEIEKSRRLPSTRESSAIAVKGDRRIISRSCDIVSDHFGRVVVRDRGKRARSKRETKNEGR